MGLECHTPIGKTLWWQCMPEIFLEGRYADLGIMKSLPKKSDKTSPIDLYHCIMICFPNQENLINTNL